MMADEYSIERVYQSFNNVIDQSDSQSIRLHEFIIAFRELAKQVLIRIKFFFIIIFRRFFDHLNVVF
jgi:hypothetical protein